MSKSPAFTQPGSMPFNLSLKTSERFPALSILISLSLGILFDSYVPLKLYIWIFLSIVLSISWIISYQSRWNSCSTVILLLLASCLGGLRHHEFWNCHAPNHITQILQKDDQTEPNSQLIRVAGVIITEPQVQVPSDDEQFNPDQLTQRTNLILDCRELISNTTRISVSGNVYVTLFDNLVPGEPARLTTFSIGDKIDVCGELKKFSERDNPSDFDFHTHFRKQKIDAVLRVKSSQAVNLISRHNLYSWNSSRESIHNSLAGLIKNNTSRQTQPVGLALLLGDRSGITPAIRKKFSQSGLIHFLAISGLHIGFFTVFIWSICHLVNIPRKVAVVLLLFAIIFYLSIIEIRPPILSAGAFCSQ